MEKDIINKVANSKLEVFDLEDYFPKEEIISIDISQWLLEGFLLKESEFRLQLKNYDWNYYTGKYVVLFCSTEAILPAWAFALVTAHLKEAKKVFQGSNEAALIQIYQDTLSKLDFSIFDNAPVILKGCAKKPVPNQVYVEALQYLQPFAKSIMFGEACSAVPLFKK
jgi:hypothetical protein